MEASDISALDRFLDPLTRTLTPDAARAIANFRADRETQARIDELADKCNGGRLTREERDEYSDYVEAIDVVATLQAKARQVLKQISVT